MLALRFSRERIAAFLREIDRVKDAEFPYDDSKKALALIEQRFVACRNSLNSLTDDNDLMTVQNACSESLGLVATYLPLLGFILRSTNVRNSFEVFGPLLRLAKRLLGPDTRLILSSEWLHSPHVYSPITDLPKYVLLGLPAFESGNPLLTALAGHELGHTAWKHYSLSNYFGPRIEKTIAAEVTGRRKAKYEDVFDGEANDLFVAQNVAPAHIWAIKQTEETFCDCLGVRLFGEAFIHAFAYLLLPGVSVGRVYTYPDMRQRYENLILAANSFDVSLSEDYRSWFIAQTVAAKGTKEAFLLSLADHAANSLVKETVAKAKEIADKANAPRLDKAGIARAVESFRLLTPASGIGSLVDILNAGWQVYRNSNFWADSPNSPVEEVATLYELVLKSIEVIEIEDRMGQVE